MLGQDGEILAMVQTGPRAIEPRRMARPVIGRLDALIRIDAAGICGSDVGFYNAPDAFFRGRKPPEYPVVRGHEMVGTVEEIGAEAAERRRLRIGDRVAFSTFMPCGICQSCLSGNAVYCSGWSGQPNNYGSIPLTREPGLWGGFATHVFVTEHTVLFRIPDDLQPELAVLYNPMGAGVWWGEMLAQTSFGSVVVVLGCGQRGLSTAIAAKQAGASLVVASDVGLSLNKLDLGLELGVIDHAINVDETDIVGAVMSLTDGRGADVVIDTSSHATRPVIEAIEVARPLARIVLGGLKGRELDGLPIDLLVRKSLTIVSSRGIDPAAFPRAIELIASRRYPLDRLRTHTLPLDQLDYALRLLGGEVDGEHPINVVLTP